MKIEDIIILGAGASKSESAPLQNELIKEFFQYYKNMLEENERKLSKKGLLIFDFFRDFWGIDFKSFKREDKYFPTFEECLGILDLANIRRESLKGYVKEKIDELRNDLIFIIGKILYEKLRGGTQYHNILVDRLIKENKLEKTAFISLNYDIIIDNVLDNFYNLIPDYNFKLDYGINFSNFKRPTKTAILLLKIHGSLNWLYCPTCNEILLTRGQKGAMATFYNLANCSICQTPMNPMIIPPTFYKEMSNPFIQQIFLKCDGIFKYAKRLFFCGYSFPDTDMHVKYLIKRAERFKGKTPEIFVINNHKEKKPVEKKLEEKRFKRFFMENEKIDYTDLSFQDFSKNGV